MTKTTQNTANKQALKKNKRNFLPTLDPKQKSTDMPLKIRQSAHYVDCKVPSVRYRTIKQGILLDPVEDKMMNTLYELLYEKSEFKDYDKNFYYTGNAPAKIINYGDRNQEGEKVCLRISLTELNKKHSAKDHCSGKEMGDLKEVLNRLRHKEQCIIYKRERWVENEKRAEYIKSMEPLLEIKIYVEGKGEQEIELLDKGDIQTWEKKAELLIYFHPVINDDIASKWIEYPSNINQLTIEALGSQRITASIIACRDYLLREHSNKRYTPSINEETLYIVLKLEKYLNDGRKKLAEQRKDEAFEVCIKLGLLLNYELQEGVKGQIKYVFNLNPDF